MPGAMPYIVDKSAYFSIIEDLLSTPQQRLTALGRLYANASMPELAGLDSTNLAPDGSNKAARIAHVYEDWFGMTSSDNGATWTMPSPAPFPTGWWTGYQGNPEAIMRETLKRAIELSLGLPPHNPGDPPPTPSMATRHWPIDINWICQGPWFQCWLLWRQGSTAQNAGNVTVLIMTPMADGGTTGQSWPLVSKITRPLNPTDPPYTASEYASTKPASASAPLATAHFNPRGMWVIGHEDYTRTVVSSTVGTGQGQITVPHVEWRAVSTDVVVVAPAEQDGGVLAAGRPYVPPSPSVP